VFGAATAKDDGKYSGGLVRVTVSVGAGLIKVS
jgi:hypothetical protein